MGALVVHERIAPIDLLRRSPRLVPWLKQGSIRPMAYSYDYSPLSSAAAHKLHSKKAWIWPGCFIALLLVNLVFFIFYPQQTHSALTPLDNFQHLNNVSAVNWTAVPSTASMNTSREDYAVVSSLYTDSYASAVIALAHSLKANDITARMILIYIPDRVSALTLCLVTAAGWTLHAVPYIPPPHHGQGLDDHFKDQYTKLNIWTLDTIGIKSVIYLDADTLVLKNFNELFTLPFTFAAVPDVFWDSRGYSIGFNAGVMFLRPNSAIFEDMLAKLEIAQYPPKFAEQAFLNIYFGAQVTRLPYAYNGNLEIKQRTPKLWSALLKDMRIVHYTLVKPFPHKDGGFLGPQELDDFFRERKGSYGGLWAEEVGWWQDRWRSLESSNQEALVACS